MAFLQHPFPDGNKMQILDAKYSVPDSHPYSKKVVKLLKLLLHRDPDKRPTAAQICNHVQDIINGGKGTLVRVKEGARPAQSFVVSSPRQKSLLPRDDLAWDDVFKEENQQNANPDQLDKSLHNDVDHLNLGFSENQKDLNLQNKDGKQAKQHWKSPSADMAKADKDLDFFEWDVFSDNKVNNEPKAPKAPKADLDESKLQDEQKKPPKNGEDEIEGVPMADAEIEVEKEEFDVDFPKDDKDQPSKNVQKADDALFDQLFDNDIFENNKIPEKPDKPAPAPPIEDRSQMQNADNALPPQNNHDGQKKGFHEPRSSIGHEEDLTKVFARELSAMRGMGFENDEINVVALQQAKGDVNLAIHFLVSQQQ